MAAVLIRQERFLVGGQTLRAAGRDEFRGGKNAAQQIIEIVSDAARQDAEALQLLHGQHVILSFA